MLFLASLYCFKSCPRVGGIAGDTGVRCRSNGFKSCPRVGGIILDSCRGRGRKSVSSRAPVWGASRPECIIASTCQCFKSCPRVGGIEGANWLGEIEHVSSRAPVWGASLRIIFFPVFAKKVSSRAPVWGASWPRQLQSPTAEVSSRAPGWGASLPGFCCLWYPQVSSRAPVWGASSPVSRVTMGRLCFKSCPRVGGI